MTFNDKEAVLRSYRASRLDVEVLEQMIADLRDSMGLKAYQISDMPRHHSDDDKMANYAHKHMILYNDLKKELKNMERIEEAISRLRSINPEYSYILASIYINGLSKGEVGRRLNISKATRVKRYKEAIDAIEF